MAETVCPAKRQRDKEEVGSRLECKKLAFCTESCRGDVDNVSMSVDGK